MDFVYVLVLVAGALVLRARGSALPTWLGFGVLSTCVGAFLFFATWDAQAAASATGGEDAAAWLEAC